jgi:hypothetical protein
VTRILARWTIRCTVALCLGWSFISSSAWGACLDGRYTAILKPAPSKLTLYFRLSNNGTIIDDIVLTFKNYSPGCNGVDPINGPLSGLRGSINNCSIDIKASAPQFKSFTVTGTWNETSKTFTCDWDLKISDTCSDGGTASSDSGGNNNNNSGGDDDDDDDDDDDSGAFADGSLRVNSGADNPDAEIIGIDFDITPNVFQLPLVSSSDVPIATATVRLIFSNGRIAAGKVMHATRCSLVSHANNLSLKAWKNPKESVDKREWFLSRKMNPDTTTVAEISSLPNVSVTGDYPIEVQYEADDTGDLVFTKEATIRIIAPNEEPNQAFITPPTPRKLFHRGVK